MIGLMLAALIGVSCIGQRLPWKEADLGRFFTENPAEAAVPQENEENLPGGASSGAQSGASYYGGYDLPEIVIFDADDPSVGAEFSGDSSQGQGTQPGTSQGQGSQQGTSQGDNAQGGTGQGQNAQTAPSQGTGQNSAGGQPTDGNGAGSTSQGVGVFTLPEIFD